MRIGVDIDDCLLGWSDLAHAACEAAGITGGNAITRWEFHEDYGVSREALWDVLFAAYEDGMLVDHPPYEGVAAILTALQDVYGHEVHLVTARGFEGRHLSRLVRSDTAEWLECYNIPHDSLTFAKDKTLLNVDAFIDDSPANCAAMVDAGCELVALRRQPHNAHLHGRSMRYLQVDGLLHFAKLIEPNISSLIDTSPISA